MDPQSHDARILVDNNCYGQFRLPVRRTGLVVRSINPRTTPPLIEISLSQLTLYGPLPAIRERLAAMVELLDRVVAEPERSGDLKMTRVGPGRWRRLRPHPFQNRPTAPPLRERTTHWASARRRLPQGPRPLLARIIPLRQREQESISVTRTGSLARGGIRYPRPVTPRPRVIERRFAITRMCRSVLAWISLWSRLRRWFGVHDPARRVVPPGRDVVSLRGNHSSRCSAMDDADLASRSGGRGEPAVRGEQCTVEHFGECNVRGVVRGDVAAQLIRTRHHGKCWVTRDREVTEVCDGRAKPSRREVAG